MKRFFFLLIILPVLLIMIVAGLCFTETGFRLLVKAADEFSGEQLTIGQSEGALHHFTLSNTQLHTPELQLNLATLTVNITLLELLNQTLFIEKVVLQNGQLIVTESTKTQPQEPSAALQIPEIKLPIAVNIAELAIKQFSIQLPAADALMIDTAHLNAAFADQKLSIHEFTVQALEQQLLTQGHMTFTPPFPLQMTGQAQLQAPADKTNLPDRLATDFSLNGNATAIELSLRFNSQTAGLFAGHMHGKAQELGPNLTWQAELTAETSSLTPLCTQCPTGPVAINSAITGDLQTAEIEQLTVNALDGIIEGQGHFNWAPELQWDGTLTAEALKPEYLNPQWPGSINFIAKSTGEFKNSQPYINWQLINLNGTLRQYQLQGDSHGQWQNDQLDLNQLTLEMGGNTLSAQGYVSQNSALTIEAKLPALEQIMPNLFGQATLSGELKGQLNQPDAQLNWSGQNIRYDQTKIKTTTGNLTLSNSLQMLDMNSSTKQISANGYDIKQLQIKAQGPFSQHQITVAADGEKQTLNLQANGAWQNNQWQGMLNLLSIKDRTFGLWKTTEPSPLSASAQQVKLTQTCLTHQQGKACTSVRWKNASGLQLQTQLDNTPLSLFAAFIPNRINVQGAIHGEANIAIDTDGYTFGQLTLAIKDGSIGDHFKSKQDPALQFHRLEVAAQLAAYDIDISVNGDFSPEGRLAGTAQVTQLDSDPQIEGSIQANLSDLSPLSTFIQPLQQINGQATLGLTLNGAATHPALGGKGQIIINKADITALGVAVKDVEINIAENNFSEVLIDGALSMDDGSAKFSGSFAPIETGYQGKLAFKGERLAVIQTPEIRATLSPDITVKLQDDQLAINGQVELDKGRFKLTETTSIVQESDDVVFINTPPKTATAATGIQVKGQLEAILKQPLIVTGMGIDAEITGNLIVYLTPNVAPIATGELIVNGRYQSYGQNLQISAGRIIFGGGPLDTPGLDILALRPVEGRQVGLRIQGTADDPLISLYSSPSLNDADTLAWIILGRPMNQTNSSEGSTLAKAALALGLAGGDKLARWLGDTYGIDQLYIDSNDEGGAQLVLGKQIGPKLFLSLKAGIIDPITTLHLEYKLSPLCSLEGETAAARQGVDIKCRIER